MISRLYLYKLVHNSKILGFRPNPTAEIIGQGTVTLHGLVDGKPKTYGIKSVRIVSDFRYQLVSVSAMAKNGITSTFNDHGVTFTWKNDGHLLASGELSQNILYVLDH